MSIQWKHIVLCFVFFLLSCFLFYKINGKLKNRYKPAGIVYDAGLDENRSVQLSQWRSWTDIFSFPVSPAQKPVIAWNLPELNEQVVLSKKGNIAYGHITALKGTRLPVVAITLPPSNFFDEQQGIYTPGTAYYLSRNPIGYSAWWDLQGNYSQRGKSSGRDCLLNFYDPASNTDTCVPARVRINGNATRAFPQKSLRLETDFRLHAYKKWPGASLFSSKSLILRNGGNDGVHTLFADYFMQYSASGLNVPFQKGFPVSCFVNSRYWGIYYLLNRYDKRYAADWLNINEKEVYIYEQGEEKPDKHVLALLKKMDENDPVLDTLIDWDNFMDYIFLQAFFMNTDWPKNNVRIVGGKNVKWRFVLYDMDFGMAYTGTKGNSDYNMFSHIMHSGTRVGRLFSRIIGNKNKREQLVARFEYLLSHDFSQKSLLEKFDRCRAMVASDILHQIHRWGKPVSFEAWKNYTSENRQFIQQRCDWFAKNFRKQMEKCVNS